MLKLMSDYVYGLETLVKELESTDESWRCNPLYSEEQKQSSLLAFIAGMLAREFDEKNNVEVCELGTIEFG